MMAQQPSMPAIWATVQAVIAQASGLETIWRYQNANQPALDYVGLSWGAFATEGMDYVVERPVDAWQPSTAYAVGDRVVNGGDNSYACIEAGTSAGAGGPTGTGSTILDGTAAWAFVSAHEGVALTLGGVREVALQIEVWSAATVEEEAKATALATCDLVVTKLRMPTARSALRAIGLTPFDPGPSNWIPSIVAVGFRGRASCDVRCRLPARAVQEFADYIASLTVAVQADGIARTVVAP